MENEVSGIAKLGIVLIALAVLIGLGFGIFQISKSVANEGVGDVQAELDSVAVSAFTTYDQTSVTGTMVNSAVYDFEGESVAILIATQAWNNLARDIDADPGPNDLGDVYERGSGIAASFYHASHNTEATIEVPIVWAYANKALDGTGSTPYVMYTSTGETVNGSFINYNALLGSATSGSAGCTAQTCVVNTKTYYMGGIYFDNNCFRSDSGFAADESGRVQFNNTTGNLGRSGRTEFIPSGAKFESFLVKDPSGTILGIAFQQINQG